MIKHTHRNANSELPWDTIFHLLGWPKMYLLKWFKCSKTASHIAEGGGTWQNLYEGQMDKNCENYKCCVASCLPVDIYSTDIPEHL